MVHRCQVLRVSRPAYSDAWQRQEQVPIRDGSPRHLPAQAYLLAVLVAITQRQPAPGLGVYSDRGASPKTQTPRR